jgi:c-di-GMP-binding flagellar brake protein YcgR
MIEMITPEGRLVISAPMRGTGHLPVRVGDVMSLYIFRDSGMLTCTVTAEDIFEDRGLKYIEVEIRSKISRYQRRDFVRFETLLPVSVWPLNGVGDPDSLSDKEAVQLLIDRRMKDVPEEDEILNGFTLDISGGGLRFFGKRMIEHGTLGTCEVFLTDDDKVTAQARIVRCEHDQFEGKSIMGAKFIGIAEPLRDKIIKYIFEEQLKRRRAAQRVGGR